MSLNGEAMSLLLLQPTRPDLMVAPADPHRWYAVYTMPKHEKHVAVQLMQRSIEAFTPEYAVVHRWKDRNKKLLAPLFPCYTFVCIQRSQRVQVLSTAGVVNIVGVRHGPTPLLDSEVDAVRRAASSPTAQPHPYSMNVGDRVRVKRGSLAGLEGIVLRANNNWRLIVAVETIMRSISVEVQLDDVELCARWRTAA